MQLQVRTLDGSRAGPPPTQPAAAPAPPSAPAGARAAALTFRRAETSSPRHFGLFSSLKNSYGCGACCMAPAAAPLHRGRSAGRAGPGRWPDRQGAGRLASPAAAASRPGRGYGRGGSEAAPAGERWLRGSFFGRDGLARSPQRKRSCPGAQATPGCDRGGGLLSPGRWPAPREAPPPLSGFAAQQGYSWPRPCSDSRYSRDRRRAAAAAAAGLLIASSPPSQLATLPGPPESPPKALGTDPACASGERATAAAPSAAHCAAGRPPSSGFQQSRLGPPPRPGAQYPRSLEQPGAEHARRGAGRGASPALGCRGARASTATLPFPSTCCSPEDCLFQTDTPSS